jgi:hypothetical protein
MANKLYEETDIQNIADAIREKTGSDATMTVSQMASEIEGISTEGGLVGTELTQAEYDALPEEEKNNGLYFITDGVYEENIGVVYNNAGAHNSIYRGAYLGSSVTEEQYEAIADGTFRNLYIGDYWTINGVNYRIACFDYYLNTGGDNADQICTNHHATIVPDTILYSTRMNSTANVIGGYIGSEMYTSGLTTAKNTINSAFGESHILKHRNLFSNTVASGSTTNNNPQYETNGAWVESTVNLMNEINVYGVRIISRMIHYPESYAYTIDKTQFPLFALNPSLINTPEKYWLRDIASQWGFCCVGKYGNTNGNGAEGALGVRPSFSIIG